MEKQQLYAILATFLCIPSLEAETLSTLSDQSHGNLHETKSQGRYVVSQKTIIIGPPPPLPPRPPPKLLPVLPQMFPFPGHADWFHTNPIPDPGFLYQRPDKSQQKSPQQIFEQLTISKQLDTAAINQLRGKQKYDNGLTCAGHTLKIEDKFIIAALECNKPGVSSLQYFCRLKCVFEKMGWSSPNGIIDGQSLLSPVVPLLPPDLREGFHLNMMSCIQTSKQHEDESRKQDLLGTEVKFCLDIVPYFNCFSKAYYYMCGTILDDIHWVFGRETYNFLVQESTCDTYTIFYPEEYRAAVAQCTQTSMPECQRQCAWSAMGFLDKAGGLDTARLSEFFDSTFPSYKKEMDQGLDYCSKSYPPGIVLPSNKTASCLKSIPFFRCMQHVYYDICRRYEPIPEV